MELIVSSIPSVKGKISVVTGNLLNLGRRNWIEYDGKGNALWAREALVSELIYFRWKGDNN